MARNRDVEPVFSVQPPLRFTSTSPCASADRLHKRHSASEFPHGLLEFCIRRPDQGGTMAQASAVIVLAGQGARSPCSGHVHGDRSRCRRDPRRFPRGGRAVGHHRAAAALPGDHRPCAGAGMRPNHRRLATVARGAVPGGAAAPWQGPPPQPSRLLGIAARLARSGTWSSPITNRTAHKTGPMPGRSSLTRDVIPVVITADSDVIPSSAEV